MTRNNFVAVRLDEAELKTLDSIADRNQCSRSRAIRLLIENSNGQVKGPAALIYPPDTRCRRLYEAFLELSSDDSPTVSKTKIRQIQLKAAIAGNNTMRTRVEMLKAQKFLVDRKDFFVVIRRYRNWERMKQK